jgi:uncharacterized 2Fe-2S/4Fe-4S cluster protein (DUF4445 family)
MAKVTFIPDDVTVEVRTGENLLRAAMMADVQISATCGGDGTCGKCRTVIEQGSVKAKPSSRLTDEQVADGYVLGCVAEVEGDVVVRIPPESRPGSAPERMRAGRVVNTVLSPEDSAARLPASTLAPAISKRLLRLSPPTLSDNASDLTRVAQALRRDHGIDSPDVPLQALQTLPDAVRGEDWLLTAIVIEPDECQARVVGFEPGDTTERQYAIAVDVGTTTVETALIDLTDGSVLAEAAEYNAQVRRGEDVISRVIVGSKPNGLAELQGLGVGTIVGLAEQVCERAGVACEDVLLYVLAGNTVMTHLLYEVTPKHIRNSPYVPAATRFPWVAASELGLPGSAAAQVTSMPCPASWLGGDIVSGVVAAGIPWSDELTLFVDIGTNGEIVLGNKDWLVACSCSAGPAFEGGGIRHGMRAADGAIEQVRIDPETLEPMILTIGSVKPLGICGSGLIDCVSELFLAGAIERNGKFATGIASQHVRDGDRGREYVLAAAAESGTGRDIVLTEADIENLMRAKAAVFAGIHVLLESVDVSVEELDEVVVAGGFGHYLDLERVMALGMVPEIPSSKFVFIGNGSLLGARSAAVSRELPETAQKVADMLTYIELSVSAGFMDMYVSATFLPHTDLSLFPETERLLRERTETRIAG